MGALTNKEAAVIPSLPLPAGATYSILNVRINIAHPQVMKLLYPVADQVSNLNNQKLTIKIARHSACTSCTSCSGLHPPASTTVVLDIPKSGMGTLDEYGSDDDEELESGDYMEICACGHEAVEHGADISEIGTDEFKRRGRVAFRLDEILQVSVACIGCKALLTL